MGWTYGWADKASLVKELTSPGHWPDGGLVTYSLRGNSLWAVYEPSDGRRFILLYLLDGTRGAKPDDIYRWGYKDMDESMHPFYYNCPLKFLGMAPVANEEWREKVREYHAEGVRRLALVKALKVGDKVKLVSTPGEFQITHLNPLLGVRGFNTYRLPKSRIMEVV
jgi:hypothetical protein